MTQTISATNKGDIYEIARKATHEAMRNCRVSDGTRLYYIMVGAITEALAAQRERDAGVFRAIELTIDGLNTRAFQQKPETQAALDRIKAHCREAIRQQDKGEPG
jgi:hypothetical protein